MLMTSKSTKPKVKENVKRKVESILVHLYRRRIIRYNENDNPVIKNRIYKEHIIFNA